MNLTRLAGVNYCLKRCGIRPVSALDTGGFSEASDIERIIDEETHSRQVPGVAENRTNAVKHVADGSGNIILGSTILAIFSAGPSQHRNLSMRLNGASMQVYDLNLNSFSLGAASEVYLDLIFEVPFESCSPGLQQVILDNTTQVYQRMNTGNPIRDVQLDKERIRSEVNLPRTGGRSETPHDNPPPFAVGGGQGQG